ncbi:MAG: hypothetical protein WCZ90_14685 [Melioribacteraceae bacterium]
MDINFILTVLGLFSTIVLGALSIRYALKFRSSSKLVYFQDSCFSLFDSFVNRVDGLTLSYKGKSLEKPLVILKGSIINFGTNDIDKGIIHKPLEMLISKEFQLLNAKIIDCSPNVYAECKLVNENIIEFNWELLKSGESITFDALLSKKSSENQSKKAVGLSEEISNSLIFNHRITNLGEIDKTRHLVNPSRYKIMMSLGTAYLLVGLVLIVLSITRPTYGITYKVLDKNSQSIVEIQPDNDILKIEKISGVLKEQIADKDFFGKYEIIPIVKKNSLSALIQMIVGVIMFLGTTIFMGYSTNLRMREKRVLKLLNQ